MNVRAEGSGRLVVFVGLLVPCGCMRCLMRNKADSLGHQFGSLEAPSGASVSVVVETLYDCGGRDHRCNLWDRK